MTAPHLAPPQSGTTERRRTLRETDLPASLDSIVLRLFREGQDTLDIAIRLGAHQSAVARSLARARDAERARSFF